jgi:hypothetical protein
MIACGLTKEYGVLAADSSSYEPETKRIGYESPKLSMFPAGRCMATYLGSPLYFSRIDLARFEAPFAAAALYLEGYFREMREDVEGILKETIEDEDERKAHMCCYLLGVHAGRPTLAQINSFQDFKPRFLWADDGVKFATLFYGDESVPGKKDVFRKSSEYMKTLASHHGEMTPGLIGEILTRGIYRKADLEEAIGDKRKYAGGVVNVGVVKRTGEIYPLSGAEVIYGSRQPAN